MESKAKILKKISSKFVLENIFNYIKDTNYKYKLFCYSKYFQNLLDIKLFDYKEKYFTKIGISFDQYFSLQDKKNKNVLNDKLKSFTHSKHIDIESLKQYLVEYYKHNLNKLSGIDQQKSILDIYSPFFDVLAQNGCLDSFIIPIDIDEINKFKLKKDYVKAFGNLDKNYSIKINFRNEKDISELKDYKINFELVNELNLINVGNEKNINYDKLFKNLFSSQNFGQNLSKLSLKIHELWNKITDSNIFEKINNLKNLKYLELNGFFFEKNFHLKLNGLKTLILKNCKNIILSSYSNLTSLVISNCIILKNESLIKLENLEKCELLNYRNDQNFNSIIDFPSLSKLKFLHCEPYDFIHLSDKCLIENAELETLNTTSKKIEKNVIEKICKLQSLKVVNFCIFSINLGSISNIKFKNKSLQKMNLSLKGEFESANFSGLINKFENLTELYADIGSYDEYMPMNLFVKEDPGCKIKNLHITGIGTPKVEIVCGPYSNLTQIKFDETANIANLADTFPLFNKNCKVVFNKLNCFYFKIGEIPSDGIPIEIIKNLYNNLDAMPNLKEFHFVCVSNGIQKELYENFVKKLLEMKLDTINFEIHEGEYNMDLPQYTLDELKEIYPLTLDDKNYTILKFGINDFE